MFTGLLLSLAGWVLFAPEPKAVVELNGYVYRVDPQDEPALARAIKLRARQLQRHDLYLRAGAEVVHLPAEAIGYEIGIQSAIDEARAALREEAEEATHSLPAWFNRRLRRDPLHVSLELTGHFHEPTAKRALIDLKARVDREPQNAALLIDEHKIRRSVEGQRLSVAATLVRLAHAEVGDVTLVDAVVEKIRPQVTEEDLAPVDVTRVLATFETSFAGKAGARAVNIHRAAKYLDGAVILPGEVLSFNGTVGERIHSRGFVDAPVIVNDEMEKDVGGGVCQVATTLHGAAVYGNLEVVRRRSHSRPSGYAPLGLDATVIDGKVDLRLRNPYDQPILVHTTFPSRYVIRVELLGLNPIARVEHSYAVTGREDFNRRVWYKEELPARAVEQKQKGSPGLDVVSVLKIQHEDGKVERRRYHSKYYPVPEVFHVGTNVPLAELPGMPEGAKSLVVDGDEVALDDKPTHGDEDEGLPSQSDVPKLEERRRDEPQPDKPRLDERSRAPTRPGGNG